MPVKRNAKAPATPQPPPSANASSAARGKTIVDLSNDSQSPSSATSPSRLPRPDSNSSPPSKRLRASLSSSGGSRTINRFSNTVLILVGEQEEEFSVHNRFLELESPFFHTLLTQDWLEKHEQVIRLPDDTPRVFEDFVDWLYGRHSSWIWIHPTTTDLARAVNLYIFADKVQAQQCKKSVIQRMHVELNKIDTVHPSAFELLAQLPGLDGLRQMLSDWFVLRADSHLITDDVLRIAPDVMAPVIRRRMQVNPELTPWRRVEVYLLLIHPRLIWNVKTNIALYEKLNKEKGTPYEVIPSRFAEEVFNSQPRPSDLF